MQNIKYLSDNSVEFTAPLLIPNLEANIKSREKICYLKKFPNHSDFKIIHTSVQKVKIEPSTYDAYIN